MYLLESICNYFGDEVKLVFEDVEKDITYHFSGCYKVKIEHEIEYHKNIASKELTRCQIPYFMQDVEVKELQIAVSNTHLTLPTNSRV